MTTIGIIIGLISIALGIWRFYYAPKSEKRKLQKEVRKLRKQMHTALVAGHRDKYDHYRNLRMRKNLQIKQLGKRRGLFGR